MLFFLNQYLNNILIKKDKMASITFNLFCFLSNIDFARNFIKYISSKDVARLIIVSKEFTPKYIMRLIKQDYKSLYYNFISQREKYYPLIFSFHFRCHDIDTLSEFLANETIKNLKSNKPMIYIPDQLRDFNPHDKKIREILYQCFSLYLSKPIQIVGEDGSISFDEVGSILYCDAFINKNGNWELNNCYDDLTIRYNIEGELDHLGIYNENGDFMPYLDAIVINPLFMLLHKFDIKLKNKLIVDCIVISPFEQVINVSEDLCEDIKATFLYPHHMNCFYGNIEENLNLITRVHNMQFYSFISAISTGMLYKFIINKKKKQSILLGNDINIYGHIVEDHYIFNNNRVHSLVEYANGHTKYRDDYLQHSHLNPYQYNIANLLEYIPL
jgi:hypothetical protein